MPAPKVVDRRPSDRRRTEADVAKFAAFCTNKLLHWSWWQGQWGEYDAMEYWPANNLIEIEFLTLVPDCIESIRVGTLHKVADQAWVPTGRQFKGARDKYHYCCLLGSHLLISIRHRSQTHGLIILSDGRSAPIGAPRTTLYPHATSARTIASAVSLVASEPRCSLLILLGVAQSPSGSH
jgi:hypothetical protein